VNALELNLEIQLVQATFFIVVDHIIYEFSFIIENKA